MKLIDTMLRSHPQADLQRADDYTDVLNALSLCAQICTSCADACLAEEHVAQLRRCIRTDLDCADVCVATSNLITRQTETPNERVHAQLHACILACRVCADECEQHAAMHDHCRVCAETCR
ncbi:MAG TPA: four-helix bundle copper-binding protein, partial [Opitutus sp.]|nr:four-helix bundle copper-binding protein [Opitutus sp.]